MTEHVQVQAEITLQQQAERERLVGLIAQRIRQSLNLDKILSTTVSEVRQFLQTDRVIIFRFQSDWSGSVVVESVDPEWQAIAGMTIYDPCFGANHVQIYKQGQVRAIENIYTTGLAQCHLDLLAKFQVQANLVVPILQGEELWGLLIAHHCRGARKWQSFEIDLLKQLATQLAIAIQQSSLFAKVQLLNTNLERQVQERTIQLRQSLDFEAMLKRVTDKVRDSLDESQILQTAVQELAVVLGVACCDTALYDLTQGTSTIYYESTTTVPSFQGQVVHIDDFPELYNQLLRGQCFQFCIDHSVRGWVTILACPIFDDQGTLGDLWLCDQTDYSFSELAIRLVQQVANQCAIALRQARLYQAAQTQVEELARLNRLKDDFLSTVSHELRTPITNIKVAIQMLKLAMGQATTVLDPLLTPGQLSKMERYLQILEDECEREISLVNDLLDLQRLEEGVHTLVLEPIQLQAWLPPVVAPFQTQAQNHQQYLQLYLAPDLPVLVAHGPSLERILAELLNNACKYTPPGERITLTVQAISTDASQVLPNSQSVSPSVEQLQLRVTNSGVEIPAAELSRIFEKFYRIPSADPWKRGGTGLGLALVQQLVACLGGTIQVESDRNQTSFTVELPLQRADAN